MTGPKRLVRVRWGLDLEKCGIVRADQAVEAKAGLLNAQRGVPRGWGADWQDLAWGWELRRIESGCG